MKILAALIAALPLLVVRADKVLYSEDFSKVPAGDPPDSIMVLDGQFAVKDGEGGPALELPGAPLESFGVLFGPNEAADVEVRARVLGTRTGRKFPTFAAGLNGVGGFKVRVVPSKNAVELSQGDDLRTTAPFKWESGLWTHLRLSVTATEKGVRVSAKAWQGDTEPAEWTLVHEHEGRLPAGRAGVWGMPYSGTPIRFDDLRVVSTKAPAA
jgi:hypothetical protein